MATHGSAAAEQRPLGRVIGTIGPRPRPTAVPGHAWNDHDCDWFPRVDVARRREGFIVTAELPGLSREDISVKISREHLVIEGIQREPFKRTIVLPDEADTPRACARLTDGVLEINIPLTTAGTTRPLALG